MLMVSFETRPPATRGPVIVVVILEKENLDRMKEADPLDVQLTAYVQHIPTARPIRDLDLIIAYEEDIDLLMELHRKQDLPGLMQYLERGRKIKPGDLAAPVPIGKNQ